MPALLESFEVPDDAYHVGLHEFAHLLDVDQTHFDGIPVGLDGERAREWVAVAEKEMERLRHGRSAFDDYGAHDPVEFLGVAVEAFFEIPQVVRRRHREVYALLAALLRPGPRRLGRRARACGSRLRSMRLDLAAHPAPPGHVAPQGARRDREGPGERRRHAVREPGLEVDEGAAVVFDPNRKALPRVRCTLPILHEDEHVLVVDKPAGLLTVPSGPGEHDEDTALRRVQDYAHRLKPRVGYAERVHRLDRDTSGAIAFALSREARAGLIETFRHHRIERRYLAIVEGEPDGARAARWTPRCARRG